MIENILFYVHYVILLAFGIILTFSFAGIRFTRKNIFATAVVFAFCGTVQFLSLMFFGEETVWKLYPVLCHFPLVLILVLFYKKRISTSLASISLAYLCCQPAKWFGLLFLELTSSDTVEYSVRILVLLLAGVGCVWLLSTYISEIFNKDDKSVWIFGIVPLFYYSFDYIMGIYTDLWESKHPVVAEFLPLFICLFFMVFCVAYYKEYEKKADAQRNEQIMSVTVQQQAKEIEAVKASNTETRLLRHDMRLMLSSLALSIEQNDRENALNMISGYISRVESSVLHRYCENDTLNYILTSYEAKCRENGVKFDVNVEIGELSVDEVMFASVISNALDNAINAQAELAPEERSIKIMLKNADSKLLLSVKNPFKGNVTFADGLPISDKKGHGYGTRSIRYMTDKMDGKCQFSVLDDRFILRVIL